MLDSPFALTVALSILTATSLTILSLPFALWLAYSRSLWTTVGEVFITLTLVLPPAVLGYFLLISFSPKTHLGHFISLLIGHPLPFSFEGLLLASILYSLPFSVQPMIQAFRSVPRSFLESSISLGAGSFVRLIRVVLPLSYTGILTGWILSFAHTVGEFGVVLMIGGNIPGRTQTLSLKAYDDLLSMEPRKAEGSIMYLIVFSLLAVLIMSLLQRHGKWTKED